MRAGESHCLAIIPRCLIPLFSIPIVINNLFFFILLLHVIPGCMLHSAELQVLRLDLRRVHKIYLNVPVYFPRD